MDTYIFSHYFSDPASLRFIGILKLFFIYALRRYRGNVELYEKGSETAW